MSNVEIHGVKFKADFVVLDYANEGEPSIMFRRDFLATTKSQVDFGLGKYKMNLTMFEEVNSVVDLLEEIGSSSEEFVKMGNANRNKGYNILTTHSPHFLETRKNSIDIPHHFPHNQFYTPLPQNKGISMKEVLDIKYKELEESKPILEVLENYVIYKKRLDEILKETIPVKINGVVEMVALVDTGANNEDDMERALVMEAYFNPFKNIIVFKKLVDFLDDEIRKCSEPIDCEYWTTKMLAEELDEKN
ncbi:hypothetical protein Tco_0687699 [Tanacetum coccineum]